MIFDTDVLIWFLRGRSEAVDLIQYTADRDVSVISMMELIQGAGSGSEVRNIRSLMQQANFRVLPVTEAISHLALTLIEEHAVSAGLKLADALIAATARELRLTLVTGNVRHFRRMPLVEVKPFRMAPPE